MQAGRRRARPRPLRIVRVDLHGGAPQMNALVLEVGQVQGGQHVARSGARLRGQPEGASATSSPASVSDSEVGAEVDDRVCRAALPRPGGGGPQTADPLFQAGAARRRQWRLVEGAAGPGLAAAGRQDFHRPEHQSRQSLLRQPPQQAPRPRAFRSIRLPSPRPLPRSRPPRPTGTSAAAWDESPGSLPGPARRGERAAPGTASGPDVRSGEDLPACKIECVLVVEPLVRTITSRRPCKERRTTIFLSSAAKGPRKAPASPAAGSGKSMYVGSLLPYAGNALAQLLAEIVFDVSGVFHRH